jgi:hypothetical protein
MSKYNYMPHYLGIEACYEAAQEAVNEPDEYTKLILECIENEGKEYRVSGGVSVQTISARLNLASSTIWCHCQLLKRLGKIESTTQEPPEKYIGTYLFGNTAWRIRG